MADTFFKVPNILISSLHDMSGTECKVLLLALYHGRYGQPAPLAYAYIHQAIGTKNNTYIKQAFDSLESRGWITRKGKSYPGQEVKVNPDIFKVPAVPVDVQPESNLEQMVTCDSHMVMDDSHMVMDDSHVTHGRFAHEQQIVLDSLKQDNNNNRLSEKSLEIVESLLLSYGLDSHTISRLIPKLTERGQGSEYITALWGYVVLNTDSIKKPVPFLIRKIEQNWQIPSSKPVSGPKTDKGKIDSSKFEHGGSSHFLVRDNCPICQEIRV